MFNIQDLDVILELIGSVKIGVLEPNAEQRMMVLARLRDKVLDERNKEVEISKNKRPDINVLDSEAKNRIDTDV